ncbi:MAG: cytochrome c biogenesis protein ResB [Planctomycetes bacterium]|nr:cytochrome c biogenesis protein ResB [Planctomycetota bacterium]
MKTILVRYLSLNLALFFILLLILFSITGAFLGADKAKLFFNSPPLAIYWFLLAALFIAGFVGYRPLRRRPSLLLCHAGCLLVLLGGLWGSQAAHQLRRAVGWEPKLTKGTMLLRQGHRSRQVFQDRQKGVFELPFIVHLLETAVTYYDTPSIGLYNRAGKLIGTLPAEVGSTQSLSDPPLTAKITQRFDNLQLQRGKNGIVGTEGPTDRSNPAYEVLLTDPEGQESRHYVFEQVEPNFLPNARFLARYLPPHTPKEYKSLLAIEKNGRIVCEKTIRVNHPLCYGGYHFYQSTFGQDEIGPYSGIMVVSDSGLWGVFSGYALLTIGLFGHYWGLPLHRRQQQELPDAH